MRHRWSVEERRYVIDNWGELTLDEMGEALGVPWRAVRECGRRMGLKSYEGHSHEKWTGEEDARLRLLSESGVPMPAIARILGRTKEACRKRTYVIKEERS